MVPGAEPCRRADQRDPRPDGAWWETRLFSDAERAALEYADALTRASDTTVTQAFRPYHDGPTAHFDEAAMREVVADGVIMDVWTRLELAEGAMPSSG